ncbi:MAG: transglutaminase-like domain-containing protein [Bacteroidetes bacterium]|nr:transglutaminase-like domain-containing protein [Bacteroidota bacterium]
MRVLFTAIAFFSFFIAATLVSAGSDAVAQSKACSEATKLEKEGEFTRATAILEKALYEDSGKISSAEREKMLFQIERMRRIGIDYSLTADQLYAQLERGIKGVTRKEFKKWFREGRFDSRMIDDTLRFVNTSRSNLFFRYPEIAMRRIPPVDEQKRYEAFLSSCRSIDKAADSLGTPYVLPKEFEVKMELTAKPGAAVPGEMIKAWLPIPHGFPYQTAFKLVSSSSKPLEVAPPESPIRSVFMEQAANDDGGAKFMINYTYETRAVHFNLDPAKVQPYDTSEWIYREYTKQGPNIVFTSKIKKLSREIVGRETNPVIKARKIYDWISRNIMYSFAREYSTIINISNYCLTHRYGDCGQEAMLFITLCRYNGIPARWQSGWYFFPGNQDIHDWTEIYVRPYGWVPVDPYMGILAMRYMTSLTETQRKEVRAFYFGGLDQYRMSANSDNNQELTPPKKFFRSDNVDFQRGEMETDKANLYFNQWNYNMDIKELPSAETMKQSGPGCF